MEKEKTLVHEKTEVKDSSVTERSRDRKTFIPRIDVSENSNELIISADISGASEKDVNISLENNVLTIEASVPEQSVEGHTLAYSEYDVGDYHRSFTLSESIDRPKITAKMNNGVLSVVLPKAEQVKPKRIPVHTA
ncbi:MAG: Hsp20/alpha crystallin family protein [Deltaproteobacteria bacterium]|nr:Hsp20/alpha crystallin family protein [Deltaproteobacteria bacterium]